MDRTYFRLRQVIADARRDIDFVTAMIRCGVPAWELAEIELRALRRMNRAERAIERMERKTV